MTDRIATPQPGASKSSHSVALRELGASPHWLPALVVGIVAVALTARFFWLINRDAVNILFSDQWDLYNSLFDHMGWWAMFARQYGPHRLGLGAWLTAVVALASGWNARAEAFAVGGTITLAMVLALLLKRRLVGRWSAWDVCIPLIMLSLAQYETLTVGSNPAHSAVPLLLIMLYALAWTLARPLWRYAALLLLNILLIYTGFGLFMGLLTIGLLTLECVQRAARHDWTQGWQSGVAWGIAVASFSSFFIGYEFIPAVGCFSFPDERPLAYPWFMSLMFARFVGLEFADAALLATTIGGVVLAGVVGACVYHGTRLVRHDVREAHTSRTVTLLLGFTLLFCANAAIGRVCSGVEAGQASRYMTLLTLGFVGVYLHLLTLRRARVRTALLALLLALLLPLPLPSRADNMAQSAGWQTPKQAWKTCYLRENSIESCNKTVGFQVFPAVEPIRPKLAYLHEHHLNLFLDER